MHLHQQKLIAQAGILPKDNGVYGFPSLYQAMVSVFNLAYFFLAGFALALVLILFFRRKSLKFILRFLGLALVTAVISCAVSYAALFLIKYTFYPPVNGPTSYARMYFYGPELYLIIIAALFITGLIAARVLRKYLNEPKPSRFSTFVLGMASFGLNFFSYIFLGIY